MDPRKFDRLTQILATAGSRRSLSATLLLAVAMVTGRVEAAALPKPRPFREPLPLPRARTCGPERPVACGANCCRDGERCIANRGCAPEGTVRCGTGYCPRGQVCRRGKGCMPAGAVACGSGWCREGFVCEQQEQARAAVGIFGCRKAKVPQCVCTGGDNAPCRTEDGLPCGVCCRGACCPLGYTCLQGKCCPPQLVCGGECCEPPKECLTFPDGSEVCCAKPCGPQSPQGGRAAAATACCLPDQTCHSTGACGPCTEEAFACGADGDCCEGLVCLPQKLEAGVFARCCAAGGVCAGGQTCCPTGMFCCPGSRTGCCSTGQNCVPRVDPPPGEPTHACTQ